MAFNIKFTGVTVKQGKYEMSFVPGEVPGNLHALKLDKSRFTEIQLALNYSDRFAILTPEEALELAGKHYRFMESGLNEIEGESSPGIMDRIEQALSGVDFVIAHRYEWESGMS